MLTLERNGHFLALERNGHSGSDFNPVIIREDDSAGLQWE